MPALTKFNFDRVKQNVDAMMRELPEILVNDAQRFFNSSFRDQNWDDKPWPVPQRKIPGTSSYKYPIKGAAARRSRAILVKTGRLRRALATSSRPVTRTSNSATMKWVIGLPYAAIHNDGLPMARGGNMPQRKFIGDSKKLRTLQMNKIKTVTSKIWRA